MHSRLSDEDGCVETDTDLFISNVQQSMIYCGCRCCLLWRLVAVGWMVEREKAGAGAATRG